MLTAQRFVNVRSNRQVEVFNEGRGVFVVATVRGDGYGPRRRVPAEAFHTSYLDADGRPRKSGYVPVNTLPGDHPHAPKLEYDVDDILDNLNQLSTEELARFIHEQQEVMNRAKKAVEKAKAVAKRRAKRAGVQLYGDVAMEFKSNRRLDEATAQRNLAPEDLQKLYRTKLDLALAEIVFKGEPEKLERCKKDHGWSLTVRAATEKDREVVARTTPEKITDEDLDGFEI